VDVQRKFKLNGLYCFVTWSQSKIDDHMEFYEKLKELLPEGAKVYGGKELHADGRPHYHAVIRFRRKVHWTDARKRLTISGDTEAIKIRVPEQRQSIREFLENTQSYCQKDDNPNVFGKIIEAASSVIVERKRVFLEIDETEGYEETKEMIRQADPYMFVTRYPCVMSYLAGEKKRARMMQREVELDYEAKEWRIPEEIRRWKEENVDDLSKRGRKCLLILIGRSKTGKTEWARSFGEPIDMTRKWNIDQYRSGATHIVVNDVNPLKFGSGGDAYWREVLGCQTRFDATDKFTYMSKQDSSFP